MYIVVIAGAIVLVSLLALCVGCKEQKKLEVGNGSTLINNHASSTTEVPILLQEEKTSEVQMTDSFHAANPGSTGGAAGPDSPHHSFSRHSSLSSHGSVRITITNIASDKNDATDLDSPVSNGGSMADRELPKLPDTPDLDEEHDYDVLDEGRTVDYDTIDNLTGDYSTLPNILGSAAEYATVQKKKTAEYATISSTQDYQSIADNYEERRASYEALPQLQTMELRRPSYEALPELQSPILSSRPPSDRSRTLGSSRPYSEVFPPSPRAIDRNRAKSEKRAQEDNVSVIYASINPEFKRANRRSSHGSAGGHTPCDLEEPPVPENPYDILDNLLEDLQIPNPDHVIMTPERVYEDLESMRPSESGSIARRTNPVIVESSPFAVSNSVRSSAAPSSSIYSIDAQET